MPSVVIYDTQNNNVLDFIQSVDPSPWVTRPDVLIFDDITTPTEVEVKNLFRLFPFKYLKRVASSIAEKTQPEKDAADAEIEAAYQLLVRNGAKNNLSGFASNPLVLRALAYILVDENNAIRQWITSFKATTALATNLANFQSRVAALGNLPDRTLAQLKTAIENRIDSGAIDER